MAENDIELSRLAKRTVTDWLNGKLREPFSVDDRFDKLGIELPALMELSQYVKAQFAGAGFTIDLPPQFVRGFTHDTVGSFITALPGQSTTGSTGPIKPIENQA